MQANQCGEETGKRLDDSESNSPILALPKIHQTRQDRQLDLAGGDKRHQLTEVFKYVLLRLQDKRTILI